MATEANKRAISSEPPPFEGYRAWLLRNFNADLKRARTLYELAGPEIIRTISGSPVWKEIVATLPTISDAYARSKKDRLINDFNPSVGLKPFASLVEKTYRKNILENRRFPSPPGPGWVLPDNWFQEIHDIARTTIAVRYLDGVQLIANEVAEIARKSEAAVATHREGRADGYYAMHQYLDFFIALPSADLNAPPTRVRFEVHVTTDVKLALKAILHSFYEGTRLQSSEQRRNWQWDFKSQEFVGNNLGHMLHYVEGMIVRLRDEQLDASA
jgi:hypothetical protein